MICKPVCGGFSRSAAYRLSCRTGFTARRPPRPSERISANADCPSRAESTAKPGTASTPPPRSFSPPILATAAPHYANTAPVPLTGEYDPETAAAVRLMQGVFILPQTGVTDRATWDALASLHNALFMRTPPEWTI